MLIDHLPLGRCSCNSTLVVPPGRSTRPHIRSARLPSVPRTLRPSRSAEHRSSTETAAFLRNWLGQGKPEETAQADAAATIEQTLLQQPGAKSAPRTAPPAPLLSGSGGGIFYFWQLGVVKYLAERYDLTDPRLAFLGASAGSLLVVLAACGVPADDALAGAHRLALEHGIFDRPLGVAGIWGAIIRRWLDDLLPPNAVQLCSGRVRLVVTEVPSFRQVYLDDFQSRDDLLDAALASSHIPFLLDWQPTARAAGKRFIDGSLRDFLEWKNSDLLTCSGAAFVVDYSQDEKLKTARLDFIKLREYEEVKELMDMGYDYAGRMDAAGRLDPHFGIAARQQHPPQQAYQAQPAAAAA